MKKGLITVIAVVVLLILAGGGYALLHTSSKPANSASSVSTAAVASNSVLVAKSSSSLGQYFTEPNGKPLYTYGKDSKGISNCTDTCLALWPAYQDKSATTNLPAGVGTIKRTDNGEIQFTYNGLPLYTFVSDIDGHVTGNGVSDFTVAKPAPANTSSNSATAPASTNSSSSSNSSSW